MSEEVTPPAPAPSPTPEAPAPAAAPAPVVEAVAAPSVAEAAPASVAAPEPTPAPEKPAEATLIGEEPPKPAEETKPADTPKEGDKPAEQPKEEASQSVETAPLPTYEAFTLPEGFQIDEKELGELTKTLGEFEIETKADHAKVQGLAQRLIDKHTAIVTDTLQRVHDYNTGVWDKQSSDWKEAFEKDPELGGNRRDTTLKSANALIDAYGGNEAQRKEFRSLLKDTRIGNAPALLRLLAKAGQELAEGRPVPAGHSTGVEVKGVMSRINKMYST